MYRAPKGPGLSSTAVAQGRETWPSIPRSHTGQLRTAGQAIAHLVTAQQIRRLRYCQKHQTRLLFASFPLLTKRPGLRNYTVEHCADSPSLMTHSPDAPLTRSRPSFSSETVERILGRQNLPACLAQSPRLDPEITAIGQTIKLSIVSQLQNHVLGPTHSPSLGRPAMLACPVLVIG